ncbi:unnamed protein product [Merluccius merluccius]
MSDVEAPPPEEDAAAVAAAGSRSHVLLSFMPTKEFALSRKGMLLIAEVLLCFLAFVCFVASTAAAFVTAPLLEFLVALFLLFAYSTKFNQRFTSFHWPLMDFLRCVSASIIFFVISIISVSKYSDGASKAAGVFGFIATIVFAFDFYIIFNDLADFLKHGGQPSEETARRTADTRDDSSEYDSD